jgi:hypothetical protein
MGNKTPQEKIMTFYEYAVNVCKVNDFCYTKQSDGVLVLYEEKSKKNDPNEIIPIFISFQSIHFGFHEKMQDELGKIYNVRYQDDKLVGEIEILNFYSNLQCALKEVEKHKKFIDHFPHFKDYKLQSVYTSGTKFMQFIIKIADIFYFYRLELRDGSYLPLLTTPMSNWDHCYKLNLAIVRYIATGKTFYENIGFKPVDEKEYRSEMKVLDEIKMININHVFDKINKKQFMMYFKKEVKYSDHIAFTDNELDELYQLTCNKTVENVFVSFYKRTNLLNNKQISMIFYLLCYIYERFNKFKQMEYYLHLYEDDLNSSDSSEYLFF